MTYYEELGVSAAASVDDIRDAYKRLVRLLHPDKLQNEKSRHVAECQMKRLNAVYETLSHPGLRAVYDASLRPAASKPASLGELDDADTAEVSPSKDWRWLLARLRGPDGVWVGAGAIICMVILFALAGASTPVRQAPQSTELRMVSAKPVAASSSRQPARPPDHADGQVAQLRRQLDEIRAERDAAIAQRNSLDRKLQELHQKAETTMMVPPALAVPAPVPMAPVEIRQTAERQAPPPPRQTLAGSWYYARSKPSGGARELYPPEFIEAVISEAGGNLRGRYRARYRVADRAISPEVVFQFSGQGDADSATLPWLGAGGSHGEVRLTLLTQNTLQIAWVANDLGATLGLGSGTAVLIRRREP